MEKNTQVINKLTGNTATVISQNATEYGVRFPTGHRGTWRQQDTVRLYSDAGREILHKFDHTKKPKGTKISMQDLKRL